MFSLLKKILLPFSFLYALIMAFRNFLYDKKMLKSESFDIPSIAIGNLSVGGTGKTPHIEYFVRLFQKKKKIAVISRGYGRKTKGFFYVEKNSLAENVGDEPLQIKQHFPKIKVAVCEKRTVAIRKLMQKTEKPQLILLDDAFQHRAVRANCYVLLTTYQQRFTNDFVLPYGRLRESRTGYKRANVIIVTKCPLFISVEEKRKIIAELAPFSHQKVFFSFLKYGDAFLMSDKNEKLVWQENLNILLVCAIAKPQILESYLKEKTQNLNILRFSDHHFFTEKDILLIEKQFEQLKSQQKIIVTTEKDAVRLQQYHAFFSAKNISVYVLPIQVFLEEREERELVRFLRVFS
ncbi:MAG: tetraacyldisaccharide 4'-kinase [Chitinophagales bacterium]